MAALQLPSMLMQASAYKAMLGALAGQTPRGKVGPGEERRAPPQPQNLGGRGGGSRHPPPIDSKTLLDNLKLC